MKTIYTCFKDGKYKALTMSYDDGRSADRRLVGIFDKYGIRGSFHLNSGLFGKNDRINADEVKELYKNHEVSAHTYTHPTIARCPVSQVSQQLLEDRRVLEELVGYPVRGMSYPNGSFSQKIKDMLPSVGIEYSRTVVTTNDFALPSDYLEWNATCHHNKNLMKNAENFLALNKRQHLYLFYVWGHSYEFDNDGNWDLIEDFCKMVGGNDDIWYATNVEIVDYLNAAENLKFSSSGNIVYNPSCLDIWISVDGEIVRLKGGEQKFLA